MLSLEWGTIGRALSFGSDCTRRPSSGLCSLTDLEAALARPLTSKGESDLELACRTPCKMRDQRDQEKNQEDHEKNLGDPGSSNGYTGEPQHSRDQRDYQKD